MIKTLSLKLCVALLSLPVHINFGDLDQKNKLLAFPLNFAILPQGLMYEQSVDYFSSPK